MNTKLLSRISASVLLISVLISGISLIPDSENIPGFDWAKFDRTSSVGPLDYTLKADFDAIGFRYSLGTSSSSSGGGIIGGMGGGLGSNITREEEWKSYPEVKGEVLENLGIIYDSYKEKSYVYELLFRNPPDPNITYEGSGSPSAYLNVSLRSDLVPYWPEGSTRSMEVAVTFLGTDLDDQVGEEEKDRFRITLENIRIKAKTGYDKETGEYEGTDEVLVEKELAEVFSTQGDMYETSVDVEFPEGEEAVGFILEIDASMNDYWDRGERSPLSGSANPINIRSMERMKLASGLGIPFAMPLIVISMVIGIAAFFIIILSGRSFWGLVLPSAILSTAGPVWYWMGMNAAVDLLGERLSDADAGLSWESGFFLAAGGAFLAVASLVLILIAKITGKTRQDETREENLKEGSRTNTGDPVFRKLEEENVDGPAPMFRKINETGQSEQDHKHSSEDPANQDQSGGPVVVQGNEAPPSL
jgi:hypothetical protein